VFSIHFVAFPKLAKYVLEPFVVREHVGTSSVKRPMLARQLVSALPG
jgi:hypothetical protein